MPDTKLDDTIPKFVHSRQSGAPAGRLYSSCGGHSEGNFDVDQGWAKIVIVDPEGWNIITNI